MSMYRAIQGKGAATNVYGFYSLTLDAGTYDIVYSYLGFSDQDRSC